MKTDRFEGASDFRIGFCNDPVQRLDRSVQRFDWSRIEIRNQQRKMEAEGELRMKIDLAERRPADAEGDIGRMLKLLERRENSVRPEYLIFGMAEAFVKVDIFQDKRKLLKISFPFFFGEGSSRERHMRQKFPSAFLRSDSLFLQPQEQRLLKSGKTARFFQKTDFPGSYARVFSGEKKKALETGRDSCLKRRLGKPLENFCKIGKIAISQKGKRQMAALFPQYPAVRELVGPRGDRLHSKKEPLAVECFAH